MGTVGNKEKVALVAAGIVAGVAARELYRRWSAEDIAGQIVLITGGSRGLGLAMARAFADEGCPIAICARDEAELERARRDLEGRGARVFTVVCDVADPGQVDRMIDSVMAHYGRIDILVNNAGIIQVGPLESMTVEDFHAAMNVMFWGTVHATVRVLPQMRARQSGRIVNITSIGGKVSVPHLLPYNCAKFATVGFSEGLRSELRPRGIKVTTIAPGLMRTGSYLNAMFSSDADSAWFGIGAATPGITMSARRAARQIVMATRRGEAERVLSTQANLLAAFHGLFPGATSDILALVDRYFLPRARGGSEKRPGSESSVNQARILSALTVLGRSAAKEFLQPQMAGGR
ncbi:MAG TPA: SDR family NAD(P)-dependent oxidoreductase [Bryobacteraceae bacterium]|nr:SDR family NAD(P)-dependent oxidoreductase [Bryobacteraceae bacterium]